MCDDECSTPLAALNVEPDLLSFVMTEGGNAPPSETLVIENTGTAVLRYTTSVDAPWLLIDVPSATIGPGADESVVLSVDASSLAAGELMATVTVEAEGATGSPASVEVGLTISPPPRCAGTPVPCAGRATTECDSGCELGAGCAGATEIDCSRNFATGCGFCETIVGCSCDESMTACVEAPDEGPPNCESQTSQTVCAQFGTCAWHAARLCSGTPTPCEIFDTATCEQAPGCSVTTNP